MTWQTFVDPAFSSRLCLMLLHSLWQVAAVALVVWSLDRLWPKRSVERSYTLHVAALLAALVAMPITYGVLGSEAERVGTSAPEAAMPASAAVVEPVLSLEPDATVDAEPPTTKINTPLVSPSATELPAREITTSFWQQAAPWVLVSYAIGVVLMLVRLMRAMMSTNRLSVGAKKIVDGPLVDTLRSLARKWSLKVVPVLAETQEIVVPKVVGLARPVILLPAAAIAGLSMGELEMILAHELAHVRRHDMWVNLVQRLAEALLFFNPPLWYLSRRISTLREYCCDEMTCQAMVDTDAEPKLRYATALLRVVELAQPNATSDLAAMAATGSSPSELRRRVARLFGEPLREPVRVTRTGMLMIAAVALFVVAGPSIWSTEAQTADSEVVTDEQGSKKSDAPATISGRIVLEDGSPAKVKGWLHSGSSYGTGPDTSVMNHSIQSSEGRFTDTFSCEVHSGTVWLKYFPEGYAPAWIGPLELKPGQRLDDVTITLNPGFSELVKVSNELGEPVVGATLVAHPIINGGTGGPVFEKTTDENGEYLLTHLADTRYKLRIAAPGYQPLRTAPLRLEPGEVLRPTMIRSKPGTGVVRFADGTPAPGTKLYCKHEISEDGFSNSFPAQYGQLITTCDATGRFSLDQLADGSRYLFVVEAVDGARGIVTDLQAGQKDVQIVLPRRHDLFVKITGDLSKFPKRHGKPFVSVRQRIRDVGYSELIGGNAPIELTEEGGTAIFLGLAIDLSENAGTQQVEVSLENDPMATKTVEINRSGGTVAEFVLPNAPATISSQIAPEKGSSAVTDVKIAGPQHDDSSFQFQLNVVGPEGTPVSNANVEIRTSPKPTADQIDRGEFVRVGEYGTFAKADKKGRLSITLPHYPKRFNLSINQPGYGPYWAGWDSVPHPADIPQEFTAKLDAAWSVGGVVVDDSGQPIADAKVRLGIEYKKRLGDVRQLGMGKRITTDSEGKWRFDSVPVAMSQASVEIAHPNFMPLRQSLPRSGFEVQQNQAPTGRIELKQGLTVTGTVTEEVGQPIEGALVRTKFLNDIREARTDEQGVYRLVGCEPRMARIVVSAKGRATDMQEVLVDSDMAPVNFSMKPGGKIRIRVVDEQGNGIPKARIFFQRWRGMFGYFEFGHVSQYADENGVWEWDEAPLDEFQADICRPGGMQLTEQPLIAREEEYVFKPPRALVVSGTVVDAKTKKPIKNFRVIPGLRNKDPRIRMNWIPGDSYEASDGTYRIRMNDDYPAHLVRIEAAGYQVAISRDIMTDEGEVDFDFELQPAEDIAATVLTTAGEPAAGAKIALGVAGSQISVQNGDIDDGSTFATRLDADTDGRFSIPARDEPFQLVITHPFGFAHLKSAEGPIPSRIALTPWARVKGTFRVGAKTAPNVVLSLFAGGLHSYGGNVPDIFSSHDVTTGEDGEFVFERVFPGKDRVGRRILLMVDEGATEVTSSQRVSAEFIAGETTTLNLGGSGQAIVGKLASPAGYANKVLWNFAMINVQADLRSPPRPPAPEEVRNNPEKRKAWWKAWKATDGGKAWTAAYEGYQQLKWQAPYITASVDRDGSFRLDDVPSGEYVLSVRFSKKAPGILSKYRFSVSPAKEDRAADPVDLGTLRLSSF
ncbi:MAG: hypothetical protein GXP26_09475 [Planctomycetes bacterium]|nr:hypothetical protein [Planctomycetota bacterium]